MTLEVNYKLCEIKSYIKYFLFFGTIWDLQKNGYVSTEDFHLFPVSSILQ